MIILFCLLLYISYMLCRGNEWRPRRTRERNQTRRRRRRLRLADRRPAWVHGLVGSRNL